MKRGLTQKEEWTDFGTWLRERRKLAGITQWEAAREFGYSTPQFISNYERGLCMPATTSLPKICQIYNITKEEMLDKLLEVQKKGIEKVFVEAGVS